VTCLLKIAENGGHLFMTSSSQGYHTSMSRKTPPIAKHTSGAAYHASTLEDAYTAVLNDLGDSIPEVPLSFFLEQVMHVLLIDSVKVKEKLEEMYVFTQAG
jgi:hypothetical protein